MAASTRGSRKLSIDQPICSDASRESGGTSSADRYFPVRTPWASGDQTICEMPFASQSGTTSASIWRRRIEYCG